MHDRRKQHRHRERSAHGVEQWPLSQPHLAPGPDIGGNRGVANRQRLDDEVAHQFAQHCGQPVAGDQAAGALERQIQQPEQIAGGLGEQPVAIGLQLARGVKAADQRTDGTAGHRGDPVAVFQQPADHADVGEAPGAAAAEHQGNAGLPFGHGDLPQAEKWAFSLRGTNRCCSRA